MLIFFMEEELEKKEGCICGFANLVTIIKIFHTYKRVGIKFDKI